MKKETKGNRKRKKNKEKIRKWTKRTEINKNQKKTNKVTTRIFHKN